MAKFTGNEGKLVSSFQIKELTDPHHALEEKIKGRGENFIQAEFFGLNIFKKLIDPLGPECVGFRVYYGAQHEDHDGKKVAFGSGKHTSRLIIVPVGADGKDISRGAGLKDMPAGDDGMTGGPTCPSHCN